MKLFGFEAEFTPTSPVVTRASVDALLDDLHDSFTLDIHVYSADLVADGLETVSVLLGIQVEDSENGERATDFATSAFDTALTKAGLSTAALASVRVTPARELVAAH